ncbi:MAG: DUF1553 domain-containing protein [Gemmataceae bacterium]
MNRARWLAMFLSLAWLFIGIQWSSAAEPKVPTLDNDHAAKMAQGLDLFKKTVRLVLVEKCLRCHGEKQLEGGLDISDRELLLKGGELGPAILPGNGKDSLLTKLIRHEREPHMPHNRAKLPEVTIATLVRWIDLGAPYDKPLIEKKTEVASWTEKTIPAEAKHFWSFQRLRNVTPPTVKNDAWCQTPIDRFILARQEAAGIAPNPPAEPRHLLRRLYFDLIGLPPAPEQLAAFEQAYQRDPQAAIAAEIDRLLASPRYGERWARHWLDLARFAESHGFEHDYDRPEAYPYRDFVIQAFNDGLPYDTFVQWQLAGDELEPDNPQALLATGFLAAGVHSTQITKREVAKHRYDEMDDMLATTGTAMLGLTIGCARCHDHKFDPIPQADYYRMVASFTTTVRSVVEVDLGPERYQQVKALFDKEHEPLVTALRRFENEQLPGKLAAWEKSRHPQPKEIPDPIEAILRLPADKRGNEQVTALLQWYRALDPTWQQLNKRVQDHAQKAPASGKVKALISTEGLPAVRLHTQGGDFLPETHYLRRGDPDQPEAVAQQNFLQVLMPDGASAVRWRTPPPQGWRTSYRRRALAEWLTDTEHGAGSLLARVIVNRLWQHHMGRGIVATPSDFGTRGAPPTHPELLDFLAHELIRNGWRLKPIHKLILTSAVYRQSSQIDDIKVAKDSDNRLYWRRPVRRLEAEVIRDSLLAVAGQLDTTMYGPGTLDESSKRRSIYFTVKRSKLIPMMQIFDAPEALTGMDQRPATTIAPQALLLMNNPHVRGHAHGFARRVAPNDKTTTEQAIVTAYRVALSRQPTPAEQADAVAFIEHQADSYHAGGKADSRRLALADFCQVLMCLNEFVYVE